MCYSQIKGSLRLQLIPLSINYCWLVTFHGRLHCGIFQQLFGCRLVNQYPSVSSILFCLSVQAGQCLSSKNKNNDSIILERFTANILNLNLEKQQFHICRHHGSLRQGIFFETEAKDLPHRLIKQKRVAQLINGKPGENRAIISLKMLILRTKYDLRE